jgi:hypothetical protein
LQMRAARTNCSRVEQFASQKPGVTRLEPHYAKAQPPLYSVQSYKGGVRDGRKLGIAAKNVLQN